MSTARFDNIQPSAGGTARNAVRGIAAAWANLNGTGTIALRDSENVSSVVDNGTGNCTFNFSNDMANVNFNITASAGKGTTAVDNNYAPEIGTATVGSIRTGYRQISPLNILDVAVACISVNGDLA